MSETFTKLFQSILRSTIWQEDSDTKVVWVTLLALADKNGYVGASLPGIAAAAGVSLTAAETAMHKFQQPDRYSRSQEHEGRRIAPAERGWTLLNYAKFREMRDTEARKEADRQRKRGSAGQRRIPQIPPRSAQAEAEANTEAKMDGWIDGSSGSSTEHRTHKPRYTGGADVAR